VPDAGATIQPVEASKVRCPRCWFPAHFLAIGALLFRCARCEWSFTLAAPTVASPAVPVSTVTAANGTGAAVAVAVSGGVVTAVTVNGTQVAPTAAQTSGTTTPAVPASTVTATNGNAWPVLVTITGGTLTAVTVNSIQVGTTAGTYLVPAGQTIAVTYSVAPTWAWAAAGSPSAVTVPAGGTIAATYSAAPTWAWALPATSAAVSAGGTALPFAAGGTSFAQGQVLIVDPAGTGDVVTVTGTPTATSVPVDSLNSAHNSGVLVTVAKVAPRFPALQSVPPTTY
jgi:hypothetical protein